jgi:hypothetical protein
MKLLSRALIASTIIIGTFAGCSKGDTGPTGLQGVQGNTGPAGNANVKPISDSTTTSSSWAYISGNGWQATFVNPYLNSTFINAGGYAEVFLSFDKGIVWNILPYTFSVDSVLSAQMTYSYSAQNTITAVFNWSDMKKHTDPVTTFGSTCYFNVVCIAASVVNKHPGTNWNSYESLQNIPELGLNHN